LTTTCGESNIIIYQSILGAQKLVDAGFESVFRLAGNYAAWVDAGYMVEN
jgi:rhodanese-related sulfurtransferase